MMLGFHLFTSVSPHFSQFVIFLSYMLYSLIMKINYSTRKCFSVLYAAFTHLLINGSNNEVALLGAKTLLIKIKYIYCCAGFYNLIIHKVILMAFKKYMFFNESK